LLTFFWKLHQKEVFMIFVGENCDEQKQTQLLTIFFQISIALNCFTAPLSLQSRREKVLNSGALRLFKGIDTLKFCKNSTDL